MYLINVGLVKCKQSGVGTLACINVRNCPLCGVYIKPANFDRHIERVHPRYSQTAQKITIDPYKCPVCGKLNDVTKTRYGLSICDTHYVKDLRPFLVKNFYLKLKEKNSADLANKTDAAFWALQSQFDVIFQSIGWAPEEATESQFSLFDAVSVFTGYLLLRLTETIPELKQKMFTNAETSKPDESKGEQVLRFLKIPKKFELTMQRLLILLDIEFQLFNGISMGSTGYYDIAVDDLESPKTVLIIPKIETETINNLLLLMLRDANAQWHGTLRKVMVPYGTSSAHDKFGSSYFFDRSLINDHFAKFKSAWNETFNTDTKMTAADFEKIWDWLKWVVSVEGITENNQTKATHFESYKSFDLDKTLVFETLKETLPDIDDFRSKIALREVVKADFYGLMQSNLSRIARTFKVRSPNGFAYYFTCREWFYNTIMPVFVNFARSLELAGPSFEKDIDTFSKFYSEAGITTGGKSAIGVMIEPKIETRTSSQYKTSRSIPWRVLEKNYPIQLDDCEVSRQLGRSTAIDLIIYANMNVYLVELKALNLECNNSIKYMRKKAPTQCAKYSAWAKQPGMSDLLKKHGIKADQLNCVRVVVCSSGIFKDLDVTCQATGECFPVVSEFSLFSTMAGIFSLSLKEPFPLDVGTMSAALKITNDSINKVAIVDLDQVLVPQISKKLIKWTMLITLDRRKKYEEITVNEDEAKAMNLFGTGYMLHEAYIGETVSWVLPKPLFIGQAQEYNFYIGTQIGNAGSTIICDKCHSAVKYYGPDKETDLQTVKTIFASSKCPLCGSIIKGSDKRVLIGGEMTKLMATFKYEVGEAFE
jgi:hypothetical protein